MAHGAAAMDVSAAVMSSAQMPEAIPVLLGAWLGGLAPDADEPNTWFSRHVIPGRPMRDGWGRYWFGVVEVRHGQRVHSIGAWLIASGALGFLLAVIAHTLPAVVAGDIVGSRWPLRFLLGFLLGYGSHLALDEVFNARPLTHLWWPLSRKPRSHRVSRPLRRWRGIAEVAVLAGWVGVVFWPFVAADVLHRPAL